MQSERERVVAAAAAVVLINNYQIMRSSKNKKKTRRWWISAYNKSRLTFRQWIRQPTIDKAKEVKEKKYMADFENVEVKMVLKLYAVSDGPPSLSVRQTLAVLGVPFELINVDFGAGDHMTEEYAKMNPQKEIPVLEDDGFYLSESNAIMQYICDKYKPESPLYPRDPKSRAIVNHRLCFNLASYYANISAYTMAPIFFDYERTPLGLKKVHIALDVFDTYLTRAGTSHAAADHLTIADFPLINSTMTLEAIGFDFSKYAKIQKWYNEFKENYPELWKISEDAMKEIQHFAVNPPDLSHMDHPIHPIRKVN